jgi:amino acid adenylation domain-containing protein
MPSARALHECLADAAHRFPERIAVVEPGIGSIAYGELDRLAEGVRAHLLALGIRPGDRVGIAMRKSIDAVAAMYGILKAGAAYVPVDPTGPAERGAYIFAHCGVGAVIAESRLEESLRPAMVRLDATATPPFVSIAAAGGGAGLRAALDREDALAQAVVSSGIVNRSDDVAYILYTSGSTGKPKGVTLTHENATSFVDWCSEVFQPTPEDRFSSHAPFHFDLSILDIHLAFKHAATLVLIGEEIGKDPVRLAPLIAQERITIWYSAPSILGLLAQFGNLQAFDYSSLRHVLFAGEVFPVKHLRALTRLWPHPRYFNLYGPTETNVCTFYEVALPVPDDRTVPYPIGSVCSHLSGRVIDEEGQPVAPGGQGELVISGPGVMQGYWDLPEQTARGFIQSADGTRWYRTGDIVVEEPAGTYIYRGRRDRMVKRRGYRVELGEIEAGLYKHPGIKEAAVIATPDEEAGIAITAFLSSRDGKPVSMIALKRFCAENLPIYMIPDRFSWQDALPKTSTDKIDYQRLKDMV